MFKIDSNIHLKYIFTFFISTLILFTFTLYIQNGTTIDVKLQSNTNITLQPKIYYATKNHIFSEEKSATAYYMRNHTYHFHTPKINQIIHLRLDPTTKSNQTIALENITITRSNWFKIVQYTLPLTQLTSDVQIQNLVKQSKKITFTTSNVDPQLHFKLANTTSLKQYDYHIILLLISIIIAIIITFILYIYLNNEHTDKLNVKMILYTLFLLFTVFKVVYYKDHVKFGYPPDEIMHLQYIKYVHTHHDLIPNFKDMPHYLSHPSLYYELMDLVYDEHASVKININNFRTLSMLLFILTFLLILYLGFSAQLSSLGHFVYLSIITSIPMHSYLGASITNDTLAMFGAIIFILGFKRLIEQNYSTTTYFILALGTSIAYFSKLTAALLILFAVIYFFIRMLYTKEWIKLNKIHISLIILFILPILYYQFSIILTYHALVPTYNVTHPEAYLTSGFYVEEQYRQHLSPYQWFERLFHYVKGGWFGIHSHHSIGKESWVGFLGLMLAHIMALIALFLKCPEENKSYCILGKLTLLAIISVQVIQYFFSYKAHLTAGYMGGLQPRYLLPFMFAFAIMASLFVERFKQCFLFTILIILMCIHALYSDFFYFLQYYH